MLQKRVRLSYLGAAHELASVSHELTCDRSNEARRATGGRGSTGHLRFTRRDSQRAQRLHEETIHGPIRFAQRSEPRYRTSDAVRDLSVVQDGASARRTPHELNPSSLGQVQVIAPARGLIAPERYGGTRPRVHAVERLSGSTRPAEQCLVERHIRGPVSGSGNEQSSSWRS